MSKPTIYGFCPAGCKYPVEPKRELLYKGEAVCAKDEQEKRIALNGEVKEGDTVEVAIYDITARITAYVKFKPSKYITEEDGEVILNDASVSFVSTGTGAGINRFIVKATTIFFRGNVCIFGQLWCNSITSCNETGKAEGATYTEDCIISEIYKIVE